MATNALNRLRIAAELASNLELVRYSRKTSNMIVRTVTEDSRVDVAEILSQNMGEHHCFAETEVAKPWAKILN